MTKLLTIIIVIFQNQLSNKNKQQLTRKNQLVMKNLLSIFFFFTTIFAYSQPYQVPIYAVTSMQPSQSGNEAGKTIDGYVTTIYHSKWSQVGIPDMLLFYFSSQVNSINTIIYTPRQNGTNGIWTNVNVSYSTQANPANFISISTNLVWQANNQDKIIHLSSAIQNPYAIKFEVNQGAGNFSSCAEMKFFSDDPVSPAFNGIDCTIPTTSLPINGVNDVEATILATGSTASSFQPGENINMSFDNDLTTLYHSSYNNTIFPILLNYRLNGTTPIDYLKYIPRSDGGTNGNLGNVVISYNTIGNSTYQNLMTFNFNQTGLPTMVQFPNQITPLNIRLSIQDGNGGFASCAEMKFYTAGDSTSPTPYNNIFANNIYSALLPGVTQTSIDTISSPFYKSLAQCIFDGNYNYQYRVQLYEVYPTLAAVSQNLKIGTYDNFENATGIVFNQGEKVALFARNIPSTATVYLAVKDFQTGFGGAVSYFALQNGLNIFQLTNGGMAYIPYFNNDSTLNNIEINIVSGKVNGYFDRAFSSNSEWPELMLNTSYPYIDIRGKYVHLVYQKESLRNGSPFDGIKLVAKYDTIVQHERMLMGFYKYNKSPKNRMLTYNEHGNGYYAGGLGVHLDLDWGPEALTDPNQLSIWGIAHEYGHVNQIIPDLNWIGTTEVTNNIYTIWVDYHMNQDNNPYTRLEKESIEPSSGIVSIEGGRINGAIYKTLINGMHLQDTAGYDVFKVLVPFWQLETYYQLAGAARNAPVLSFNYPTNYTGIDYAHWYSIVAEVARNTNSSGLTNGELLLSFVINTCDAVQENLTDFFVKTGFLKPIDLPIDDYGIGQLTITQQEINQTIAYIQSKGYPQPVSPVIHYASAHSINMFRNQLPLSGITGIGVMLNGNYLTVQHSAWKNAVAYETYDSTNQLIYVSISGTGDVNNQTTKIYYSSNSLAVYAVGFDGQRILVYPTNLLSISEPAENLSLIVFPNPVGKNHLIHIKLENASDSYTSQIISIDGRLILTANGTIDNIENELNSYLPKFNPGVYLIILNNKNGIKKRTKLMIE